MVFSKALSQIAVTNACGFFSLSVVAGILEVVNITLHKTLNYTARFVCLSTFYLNYAFSFYVCS